MNFGVETLSLPAKFLLTDGAGPFSCLILSFAEHFLSVRDRGDHRGLRKLEHPRHPFDSRSNKEIWCRPF